MVFEPLERRLHRLGSVYKSLAHDAAETLDSCPSGVTVSIAAANHRSEHGDRRTILERTERLHQSVASDKLGFGAERVEYVLQHFRALAYLCQDAGAVLSCISMLAVEHCDGMRNCR